MFHLITNLNFLVTKKKKIYTEQLYNMMSCLNKNFYIIDVLV